MPRHQGLYNGDGKQQPSDISANPEEIFSKTVLCPKGLLRSLTADKFSKRTFSLSK